MKTSNFSEGNCMAGLVAGSLRVEELQEKKNEEEEERKKISAFIIPLCYRRGK